MRELIVTAFVSADGVMEAPGGGDHRSAGWTFQLVDVDEAAYEIKGREQSEAGALLLGAGKRLFSETDKDATKLQLVEHEAYGNGVQKQVLAVVR